MTDIVDFFFDSSQIIHLKSQVKHGSNLSVWSIHVGWVVHCWLMHLCIMKMLLWCLGCWAWFLNFGWSRIWILRFFCVSAFHFHLQQVQFILDLYLNAVSCLYWFTLCCYVRWKYFWRWVYLQHSCFFMLCCHFSYVTSNSLIWKSSKCFLSLKNSGCGYSL